MATGNVDVTLYAGKHHVVFQGSNHRYTVDGKATKGVTTIIGDTLAKPALMLWPLNECLKSLGAIWDEKTSDWYVAAGELNITQYGLRTAAKAYLTKRDKAASTGTDVHAAVEKFLKAYQMGESYMPTMLVKGALKAYGAFISWWSTLESPEVLFVERVIYSETMDYAGTLDFIIKIDGKVYLCDLKTTNASRYAPDGVYPEHFLQLGAYYFAYAEECEVDESLPRVEDLMIVSCQKNGHLRTKKASELGLTSSQCAYTFTDLMSLYRFKDCVERSLQGKEHHAVQNSSR